jgi:hypothetical protein
MASNNIMTYGGRLVQPNGRMINNYTYDADTIAFWNVVKPYDVIDNIAAVDKFIIAYKAAHSAATLAEIGDTAIYLMYGATAVAHSLNLINPSLSNPYNITWKTIATHDNNGVTFAGIQYADSNVIPSTHLITNNVCIGVYFRLNVKNNQIALGSYNTVNQEMSLYPYYTNNNIYSEIYKESEACAGAVVNSLRLKLCNRTSSSVHNVWSDGIKINEVSTGSGTPPTFSLGIGGRKISPTVYGNNYNNCYSFIIIGRGKTDSQCIDITNAVNQLQVDLGRNV